MRFFGGLRPPQNDRVVVGRWYEFAVGLFLSSTGCARHTRGKGHSGQENFRLPLQQCAARIARRPALFQNHRTQTQKTRPGFPRESGAIRSFTRFFRGRRPTNALPPYTYCWVLTSMTPRVVIRRVGITGRAMKLRVINGSIPGLTPRL